MLNQFTESENKKFDDRFVLQGIPIRLLKWESKDGLDITASQIKSFMQSRDRRLIEKIVGMEKQGKLKTEPSECLGCQTVGIGKWNHMQACPIKDRPSALESLLLKEIE